MATKEQLLIEADDLLRTMPPKETLRHSTPENLEWLGRALAFITHWRPDTIAVARSYVEKMHTQGRDGFFVISNFIALLQQAKHDLRMETLGPVNVAVQHGMTFDYFDEIRKIVELAKQDLFFIDPYLDADFVSRYLPHAAAGVSTRLLAREKLATLLPAVDAFVQQQKATVQVRSAPNFHDRYLIVDRTACYQSGASFKDGGRTAPTTLTQITDAFSAMLVTYEDMWNRAKIER